MSDASARPVALVLPSKPLPGFILADQVRDLCTAAGVSAVDPPRPSYGAVSRLPRPLADAVGGRQGRRLAGAAAARGERVAAVVIYHPAQYHVARAIVAAHGAELWYSRWDRYEETYDASPRRRRHLAALHDEVARAADITFACSVELLRLEHEAGREAILIPLSADDFPAPDPGGRLAVVALPGTDAALLARLAEHMPELVLLGAGEVPGDGPDNLVGLGPRTAAELDQVLLLADAALVAADGDPGVAACERLGRRAIILDRDLAGVATALRAQAGVRARPHVSGPAAEPTLQDHLQRLAIT